MLDRFDGNVTPFAKEATGSNRTVFGSATQSDDINDNINADFKRGWEIAGLTEAPTKQDFNAVSYTLGNLISYVYQQGIAEWNNLQEYKTNSYCVGTDGGLYRSKVDGNINNDPTTSSTAWDNITGGQFVDLSTDQDIGGIKTFTTTPKSPQQAPTDDYDLANKKYADDQDELRALREGNSQRTFAVGYATEANHAVSRGFGDDRYIDNSSDAIIGGVKTLTRFLIGPSTVPTLDFEMANKKYVDDEILSAITTTDFIDLSTPQTVTGLKTFATSPLVSVPLSDDEVSNKKYVDDEIAKTVIGTGFVNLTDDQDVDGVKTFNNSPLVNEPFTDGAVANKKYVDDEIQNAIVVTDFVNLVDDQVVGGLKTFSTLPLANITPTSDDHLANKKYIDDVVQGAIGTVGFVDLATDQDIDGVKSFIKSPIVPAPTLANDVVNKVYADGKVSLNGDETVYGSKEFDEVPSSTNEPVLNSDLANKVYVDGKVSLVGDENIDGLKSFTTTPQTNVVPVDGDDLANKTYVDGKVSLNGDEIVYGSKEFDEVPSSSTLPTLNSDLANKIYVDDKVNGIVIPNAGVDLTTDQTIGGDKTFVSNPISTTTPTSDGHLANKKYIDDEISGAIVGTGFVNLVDDQDVNGVKSFIKSPIVPLPTLANDVVNKDYADGKVSLTGNETVYGVKEFISIPYSSVVPLSNADLTNKKYVDDKVNGIVIPNTGVDLTTDQTIGGVKTFTSNPITNVTPTSDGHLANKKYADTKVGLSGNQSINGDKIFNNHVTTNSDLSMQNDNGTHLFFKNSQGDRNAIVYHKPDSNTLRLRLYKDASIQTEVVIEENKVTSTRDVYVGGDRLAKVNEVVTSSGNQGISGTKTFHSSPNVPTPTQNSHAATKLYVDNKAAGTTYKTAREAGKSYSDGEVASKEYVDNTVFIKYLTRAELDGMIANQEDLTGAEVGKITDFSRLFYSVDVIVGDISGWDVSEAYDMRFMFYDTNSFNQDISGWDVSGVYNMWSMFRYASSFNQDISGWDVSSVSSCAYFRNYSALTCSNTPALPTHCTDC